VRGATSPITPEGAVVEYSVPVTADTVAGLMVCMEQLLS